MPEIAGDAGLLVDPESFESIADAMRRIAEKPELRAELSVAGLRRAHELVPDAALLLEGGATLATAFLGAGLIDRMMVFTAPVELGVGPGLFTRPVELPAVVETSQSGRDILTLTELREP